MLKCVVFYGGAFVATSSLSISVVPKPLETSIHPLAVTSERDVIQVIECFAVFPAVGSDVTAVATWFSTGGKKPKGNGERVHLRPILVSGMYQ